MSSTGDLAAETTTDRRLEPLAVAAGGMVGTVLRWGVTSLLAGWAGLVVTNLIGTLIAVVALRSPGKLARLPVPGRPLVVVGVAGGCTTASTVLVDLAEQADVLALAGLFTMLATTGIVALLLLPSHASDEPS